MLGKHSKVPTGLSKVRIYVPKHDFKAKASRHIIKEEVKATIVIQVIS